MYKKKNWEKMSLADLVYEWNNFKDQREIYEQQDNIDFDIKNTFFITMLDRERLIDNLLKRLKKVKDA